MDRITVRQARSSLYAMQLLALIVSGLALAFGMALWAVLGTAILFALCAVLVRIGLYHGTRAWSVTKASSAAGKGADGGYSPASVRRGCLFYVLPCCFLTALYLCACLLNAPAPLPQGQSGETPPAAAAEAGAGGSGEDAETAAAAGAGGGAGQAGSPAPALAGPSSPLAQSARLACWIGALPFLPPAAFFTQDLSSLSLPVLAVLLLYPLLFPACYAAGYACGPRAYARQEDAMRRGRRRARARSRIMKGGKPVI